MSVTIAAVDATGAPLTGVVVSVPGGPALGLTGAGGGVTLPIDARSPVSLTFRHERYITETAHFTHDAVAGAWDNALVSRTVHGADVTLRVQLGRCATAPTLYVADADVPRLPPDPKAALLFHPPRYPNEFAYRGHWNDDTPMRLARDEVLPASRPPAGSHGWDNFQSTDSGPVPIASAGRFFWLTYSPRASDTQYVVAIWSPSLPSPAPLPELSMILFYSPHTGSFLGAYPFGLVPDPSGGPMDQPYATLGSKYLLNVYNMAYETSARGNPSVVVMPICRHGDWGPFDTGEGAARLLAEVAVFLHRECRTSSLATRTPGIDPLYRLAGASLRDSTKPITATDFGAAPPVGKVAVCFFSTGAGPAKRAMGSWGSAGRFPSSYWGMPGQNAQAAWETAWREIWDLDGFHPDTGGWGAYLTLLRRWYAHDSTRSVRLCHSGGRVPPDPETDAAPFWQDLKKDPVTLRRSWLAGNGPGWARELHTTRSSVVAFADGYIRGGSPTVHPVLGDAHHATCSLAFSHASGITNVGVRHPVSRGQGTP